MRGQSGDARGFRMLLFLSLFSAAGCYGGGDDESKVSEVDPKAVVAPSGTAVKQPIDSPKQNSDAPAGGQAKKPVVYLKQNWTPEESQKFYYTSQGSQILPYDWFLILEQPDNTTTAFRDDANLLRTWIPA